ncbi:hypothetical protein [Saccharibacillus sp. O23]|nr:hypothetical protein [Saccharibacillus sp. O23]
MIEKQICKKAEADSKESFRLFEAFKAVEAPDAGSNAVRIYADLTIGR